MIALPDEDLPLHPLDEALVQGEESSRAIARPASDFLHFPWASLDSLVGGIAPGDVWIGGAFSGHGKTTFAMSAVDAWYEQGKRIYYLGLESKPSVLRTQWACMRLGLSAGDVLSGKLAATAADWPFTRKRIVDEIERQTAGDGSARFYFSPVKFVDAPKLRSAYDEAEALGSDIVVIDHMDHLQGDGGLFEASVQVTRVMLDSGQRTGRRTFALTQFNNEIVKTNRLALHMPPSPSAVYMGGHKRMAATGMLAFYKPFKPDITKEEMAKFSRGELEPQDVIERGVMAALLQKHRLYGEREGKRALLGVERGRVVELNERDRYATVDKDGFRMSP